MGWCSRLSGLLQVLACTALQPRYVHVLDYTGKQPGSEMLCSFCLYPSGPGVWYGCIA
jgi:hypothetical protein